MHICIVGMCLNSKILDVGSIKWAGLKSLPTSSFHFKLQLTIKNSSIENQFFDIRAAPRVSSACYYNIIYAATEFVFCPLHEMHIKYKCCF